MFIFIYIFIYIYIYIYIFIYIYIYIIFKSDIGNTSINSTSYRSIALILWNVNVYIQYI